MIPAWPESLPLPTIEGYGISPQDGILRTAMDMGPARQRRRYTTTPTRIAVRWLMNAEQCALFEGWYRWYGKEGGAWFDITLLGGVGLTSHQARFTKPYEAHLKGGRLWEIVSELEVRERPTLDLLRKSFIKLATAKDSGFMGPWVKQTRFSYLRCQQ